MQTLAHCFDIYWLMVGPLAVISCGALILMNKKSSANPSTEGTKDNANY
jgi:hypothetical protein